MPDRGAGTRVAAPRVMDLIEAIYARRAVRSYAPRKIDDETLRTLLRAAVQAPSAMNLQPWRFAIVQDRTVLSRWSDQAKSMLLATIAVDPKASYYRALLESPSYDIFYDAGTLVVVGVEERGPFSEADCWLAAENLMLAACDLGIGSCCIGFALGVLNVPAVKAELGLPPDGAAVAPIILGYPSSPAPAVEHKEPTIVSWRR